MKEKIKIGKIIGELSGSGIITSEFLKGVSLEKVIKEGSQELRNRVGSILMEVTLR
jgi:predicted unusual protein kinase regulating ubiquinone biosynthesis (AarF/ABC1/UbiB family)